MDDMNGRVHLDHHLSEDLLMGILARLPVKSLLRFKCVCKHWYALIESPNFVSNHYHHPNNRSRVVVRHVIEIPDYLPFSIVKCRIIEQIQYALSMFRDDETLTPIDDEIVRFTETNSYTIVGPIDGLFLLHTTYNHRVAIWNPATTEFRLLPKPNLGFEFPPSQNSPKHVFGFGLDPLTNDYKVVWILDCSLFFPTRKVALYTLGSDSWRHIIGPVSNLGSNWYIRGGHHCKSNATYLNGCYYWLSKLNVYQHKLVLFDMGSDVFREIRTPAYCNSNPFSTQTIRHHLTLALHDDSRSIALLIMEHICHSTSVNEFVPSSISVCVLKNNQGEEEEEGCWTKLYTLQLAPHPSPLLQLRHPLGLWKNNGIFFQNDTHRLVLYNNNTHEIIDLGVRAFDFGSYDSIMVFNYKESLVSVGGEKKDKSHAMFRDFFLP